jgi:hypothetical protein
MHIPFSLQRNTVYGLVGVTVLSGGMFLLGVVSEPRRSWANLLVASYGLLGLGLGGAVLLALFFVTGARWCDLIRPAAANLIGLLPVGALGVALVLVACPTLYPWTTAENESASRFQNLWLTRPFFLGRAFIYLALWIGLAFTLRRASRGHDARASTAPGAGLPLGAGLATPPGTRALGAGLPTPPDTGVGIAALFLVVFALTCSLASVDWIMSLEPKWTSTVFGIYHFSGMFLGALAALIVLVIWFDRRGLLVSRLQSCHLHDLGTLLFSFSSFWMYIWFSQYLLIWYVNNPEETEYFLLRQQEPWRALFVANLVLNWGVPFLVLLFRRAKESSAVLLIIAVIILIGRCVDLYLMVVPAVAGKQAEFLARDAFLLPGTVALAALVLSRRLPVQARALTS